MTMLNRIIRLEQTMAPVGNFHWLDQTEPGQTVAEATAAYEVIHGPIGKNDIVFRWDDFAKEPPKCA